MVMCLSQDGCSQYFSVSEVGREDGQSEVLVQKESEKRVVDYWVEFQVRIRVGAPWLVGEIVDKITESVVQTPGVMDVVVEKGENWSRVEE